MVVSHSWLCFACETDDLLLHKVMGCVHAIQSGTKLLFAEIKIALRLINKALHGHQLTR